MSALHRMGKINWIEPSKPKAPARSTNIVMKRKKSRKNTKKKAVAPSFKQAWHMMQPSKEIRFDSNDTGMNTQTSIGSRTHHQVLDNIAKGTALNQRLGSTVHASYVHFKFTVANNSTVKSKAFRVLVVREVNKGGLDTSTMDDLFSKTGTGFHTPNGTQADIKWPVNRNKLYVHYDKTFKIQPESENFLKKYLKIRLNSNYRYAPNSTDSTPYHGYTYLIVLLSDLDNTTTTTTCVFDSSIRVFFKDGRGRNY